MDRWLDIMEGTTGFKGLSSSRKTEYAVDQEIDYDLAFNLWVNEVLKKRLWIKYFVKKRNACYIKKTHKFGIEVPKSVDWEYALDKKNGNTLWADAISKQMKDVSPDFRKLDNG